MANIIENHDEPRGVSRYLPEGECTEDAKKMLATVMMMLRGLPFIYQGQEIGMTNCAFPSIEDIDDINSRDEYQVAVRAGCSKEEALKAIERYSRDNCRTPFQWSAEENAGFTSGKPWLMVNPNYIQINAGQQMSNEDSVLSHYKRLIRLRKSEEYKEAVVYGSFQAVYTEEKNLIAFLRKGEEKTLLILANFQKEGRILPWGSELKKVLINNKKQLDVQEDKILLEGYQAVVLEICRE